MSFQFVFPDVPPALAVLVSVLVLAATPATAADTYGVLAYSRPNEALLTKFGCSDLDDCRRSVSAKCGKGMDDTKTCAFIWFKNECGAFAKASNGRVGLAWAPDVPRAEETALRTCSTHGGKDCVIRQHMCSDGSALWFDGGQW